MSNTEDLSMSKVNDDISLYQNPKGLMFGTDALLLAAFIRPSPKETAAEFGSGTGIISLLLAKRKKFRLITAIEVQEEYAELTEKNIRWNGLQDSVKAVHGDIRDHHAVYDAVFTNPPYMKTTSGFPNENSGKYIARHEVMGDMNDFCKAASSCLRFGGKFYCVYRPDRICDLLYSMRQNTLEPKRMVFVHRSNIYPPSLVLIEAKKGAACGLSLQRPLILTDVDGNDTEDIKKILLEGNFYVG